MRNARATPPHALNITHSPALIQAPDHHALSDIGLETQTMKPAIRGACVWDVPADYVKVAFSMCPPWNDHRAATMRQVFVVLARVFVVLAAQL